MTRNDLFFVVQAELCDRADAYDKAKEILALFDRYEAEQWRPCSEPPDTNRRVLLSGNPIPAVASYRSRLKWWYSLAGHIDVGKDEHWRELPAPPKGKEG